MPSPAMDFQGVTPSKALGPAPRVLARSGKPESWETVLLSGINKLPIQSLRHSPACLPGLPALKIPSCGCSPGSGPFLAYSGPAVFWVNNPFPPCLGRCCCTPQDWTLVFGMEAPKGGGGDLEKHHFARPVPQGDPGTVSREGEAAFFWQGGGTSSSPESSWKPGSSKFVRASSQISHARCHGPMPFILGL